MPDKFLSPRMALDQRAVRLEQMLDRGVQLFARVPLQTWKFLVTLLLVLWISHSLARLFWLVVPAPVIPPAAVALTAPAASGSVNAQSVDIQALRELQIFGQAQQVSSAEPVAPPPIETETVDTQLNLVLMGVIASSDESAGRAIIAAGGQQEVYAPGAALPVGNGVTLAKVMDLRVILNNNGRFESLWLYQEGAADARRRPPAASYTPPANAISRSWSDDGEQQVMEPEQQPIYVDRSPDAIAGPEADPAAEISSNISDVVAMSIHREGGQIVGYKIRPGRNAEQFNALGLQADDIVTAVNGVPLNNPGKIMEIYKNMSNATSASLEIRRGGSVLSVDVVLQ